MDIEDLIDKVFRNDIKEPNSIGVSFEGMDNTKELFETFLTIFTEGMKIHFGNNGTVDLNSLNAEEFMKIEKYFLSIGIILRYHKIQIENMDNKEIINSPNIEYKYDLKDKTVNIKDILNNYQETPTKDLMIPYKEVNSTKIEDYKFQIRVQDNVYVLYFKFL